MPINVKELVKNAVATAKEVAKNIKENPDEAIDLAGNIITEIGKETKDVRFSYVGIGLKELASSQKLQKEKRKQNPTMSLKRAYTILQLKPSCTELEVKRAYRKLSKIFHPDTSGEDTKEQFEDVTIAYETIKKERNIK